MKKTTAVILALLIILGAALPASALSQNESKVEIEMNGMDISIDDKITKIGDGIYQINDYGIVCAYLIVGSKSCLLIDSGVGFSNFRERVEKYTEGKPIVLALTHGHVDHAGGSEQFETVYLNEADNSVLWQRSLAMRTVFTNTYMGMIYAAGYTPKISNENNVKSTLYNMEDGHQFKLGNRTVTFYLTPGHTAGSGCFSDSKTGYLFTGDMTGYGVLDMFIESQSVSVMSKSLEKILKLEKNATKIYISHSKATIEPAVTVAIKDAADEIIDDSLLSLLGIMVKMKKTELSDGTEVSVFIVYCTDRVK